MEEVKNRVLLEDEEQTGQLVRLCCKCNTPYIKDGGCNRIRCTRCLAEQCYTCGEVIHGYSHFRPGGCSMYDH